MFSVPSQAINVFIHGHHLTQQVSASHLAAHVAYYTMCKQLLNGDKTIDVPSHSEVLYTVSQ